MYSPTRSGLPPNPWAPDCRRLLSGRDRRERRLSLLECHPHRSDDHGEALL